METQFMGETEARMTTTHMIERDPATFHEIWHDAWREAWEASTRELTFELGRATVFVEDMIGGNALTHHANLVLHDYERPA